DRGEQYHVPRQDVPERAREPDARPPDDRVDEPVDDALNDEHFAVERQATLKQRVPAAVARLERRIALQPPRAARGERRAHRRQETRVSAQCREFGGQSPKKPLYSAAFSSSRSSARSPP